MATKKNWDFIDIIGYDCGWGCLNHGCEDGPEYFDHKAVIKALTKMGITTHYSGDLGLKDLGTHDNIKTKEDALPLIQTGIERLANKSAEVLNKGGFPIIIGGDHSSAMGTWAGVTSALDMEGEFGLIWLDAHMDAHTPETAHQGKWGGWWHAMPVTSITGHGLPQFTNLMNNKVKINPKNITLIGIRSFEDSEKDFIEKHGIKAYTMDDLNEIGGFQVAFDDAMTRAKDGTKGFGLSIDLDGFDPADAPAVGTPEKHGLIADDVLKSLTGLAIEPAFRALEIAEYNPTNEKCGITKDLITKLILQIMKPI